MKKHSEAKVKIEGHTDSVGTTAHNQSLGQQRVNMIAELLTEYFGIEPTRFSTVAYGEDKPMSDNNTAKGRRLNRRVVAVVTR